MIGASLPCLVPVAGGRSRLVVEHLELAGGVGEGGGVGGVGRLGQVGQVRAMNVKRQPRPLGRRLDAMVRSCKHVNLGGC